MKVAIVHDFLREYGGAERVVEILHEIYPKAPIYTAFVDFKGLGTHAERIRQWDIKTTWAANIPFITKLFSPLRFLAPFFFSSLDLSDYDVVISSSNAYYAKAIIKRKDEQVHICYCHTPPRSLYGYATAMDWKKHIIIRWYGYTVNHFLRMLDFSMSQKPTLGHWGVDYFIANSEEVKKRIEKFYRRDSTVIYPPVDISKEKGRSEEGDYYLYVGRLTYSRHLDVVIKACNELKKHMVIVGKGAEERNLRKLAGETITFKGSVSDEELKDAYRECRAVIYPAEDEDFGIVPVEAMGYGKGVIVHRSGGVQETVVENITGTFFEKFSKEELVSAIRKFEKLSISSQKCISQAEKFSKEKFVRQMKAFVSEKAKN